ncbi:DUF5709 domain-containing protein [Myceligenerans xiligouense]|uniref:DUF5709 domain-containing protein n=1 Tax=Myceligenerans xiligouense TaxID=253184 RepID=A0A3N4YRN4_9MICO|nr:DUF5709 domain-containing protein [Myceligenerans xiligouense]RPF22847.1 hypothetical protein EDD34_3522 [Myceligenerans xiligouense]
MSGDTPATSPDPEHGAEGDTDQLQQADTLVDRGTPDVLDEGYSPPDYPRKNHWGETPWEESHGEPLDQRLAEEEPESWDGDPLTRPDTSRAGRLVEDDDADPGEDGRRQNDLYGDDAGIDGAGASAEEAAVHWVEEP